MFNDVDETLRALLIADVPVNPAEVEITFERPTRDWSSRLTGPTLNVFLFDIRERTDFRDDSWRATRQGNGSATQERGPRRVDLSYIVSAWAREASDEHRILARVLAAMYRTTKVAPEHLQGDLANVTAPVLLRTVPPDYQMKPVDFWGVMDNELRTSLTWVATVPMDVFAATTGPMVISRELGVGPRDGSGDHRSVMVAGVARMGEEPVGGAAIRVDGIGGVFHSDGAGKFRIPGLKQGKYSLEIEAPGGRKVTRKLDVPSESYDLELDAPTKKR